MIVELQDIIYWIEWKSKLNGKWICKMFVKNSDNGCLINRCTLLWRRWWAESVLPRSWKVKEIMWHTSTTLRMPHRLVLGTGDGGSLRIEWDAHGVFELISSVTTGAEPLWRMRVSAASGRWRTPWSSSWTPTPKTMATTTMQFHWTRIQWYVIRDHLSPSIWSYAAVAETKGCCRCPFISIPNAFFRNPLVFQLCFAYKGMLKDEVGLKFKYVNTKGQTLTQTAKVNTVFTKDDKWVKIIVRSIFISFLFFPLFLSNSVDDS